MRDWKDALDDFDLTTAEGLEAVKRLFVEQSREQQIESLKNEEDPVKILDTFGAIAEYNDFIEQPERPQPQLEEAPSLVLSNWQSLWQTKKWDCDPWGHFSGLWQAMRHSFHLRITNLRVAEKSPACN